MRGLVEKKFIYGYREMISKFMFVWVLGEIESFFWNNKILRLCYIYGCVLGNFK